MWSTAVTGDSLIKLPCPSHRTNTAPESLFVALVVWLPDCVTVCVLCYAGLYAPRILWFTYTF